jgi:D-hexose-6-phosphate mutarotase
MQKNNAEQLKPLEIESRVTVLEGNGELLKIEANADRSAAEIYLHGAHVTDFRRKDEPPLLFLSRCSRFHADQPIRGGVPVIFPWFGPREGEPVHGFARLAEWSLHEVTALPEGGLTLRFGLSQMDRWATCSRFNASYVVTITDRLELELILTNTSAKQELPVETCLHTYFQVGDIAAVEVAGLEGLSYLDKVDNFALRQQGGDALKIDSEVDRIYLDATGPVEIRDERLRRKIRVEKSGSASTIVWNPWTAKAQQMPDFGDEEYRQMLCVESGNVGRNRIVLAPGRSSALKVMLSAAPL